MLPYSLSSFIHTIFRAINRGVDDGKAVVQMSEVREQLSSVLLCYAAFNGFNDDLAQMVATGSHVNSGNLFGALRCLDATAWAHAQYSDSVSFAIRAFE